MFNIFLLTLRTGQEICQICLIFASGVREFPVRILHFFKADSFIISTNLPLGDLFSAVFNRFSGGGFRVSFASCRFTSALQVSALSVSITHSGLVDGLVP